MKLHHFFLLVPLCLISCSGNREEDDIELENMVMHEEEVEWTTGLEAQESIISDALDAPTREIPHEDCR